MRRKKYLFLPYFLSISLVFPAYGQGLVSPVIQKGNVTINKQNHLNTVINQKSNKAVVDWQDFSISKNHSVNINQPNSQSIILNRVVGKNYSIIDGSLNANGQVWLLNPNGTLVGKDGSINAHGFMATTHGISNTNFINGNYKFKKNNQFVGQIINKGKIHTKNGYTILAGKTIKNDGIIQATLGKIALGSGESFTIDFYGDHLLKFDINQEFNNDDSSEILNSGALLASQGQILITSENAKNLISKVINYESSLEAQSVRIVGDDVIFENFKSSNHDPAAGHQEFNPNPPQRQPEPPPQAEPAQRQPEPPPQAEPAQRQPEPGNFVEFNPNEDPIYGPAVKPDEVFSPVNTPINPNDELSSGEYGLDDDSGYFINPADDMEGHYHDPKIDKPFNNINNPSLAKEPIDCPPGSQNPICNVAANAPDRHNNNPGLAVNPNFGYDPKLNSELSGTKPDLINQGDLKYYDTNLDGEIPNRPNRDDYKTMPLPEANQIKNAQDACSFNPDLCLNNDQFNPNEEFNPEIFFANERNRFEPEIGFNDIARPDNFENVEPRFNTNDFFTAINKSGLEGEKLSETFKKFEDSERFIETANLANEFGFDVAEVAEFAGTLPEESFEEVARLTKDLGVDFADVAKVAGKVDEKVLDDLALLAISGTKNRDIGDVLDNAIDESFDAVRNSSSTPPIGMEIPIDFSQTNVPNIPDVAEFGGNFDSTSTQDLGPVPGDFVKQPSPEFSPRDGGPSADNFANQDEIQLDRGPDGPQFDGEPAPPGDPQLDSGPERANLDVAPGGPDGPLFDGGPERADFDSGPQGPDVETNSSPEIADFFKNDAGGANPPVVNEKMIAAIEKNLGENADFGDFNEFEAPPNDRVDGPNSAPNEVTDVVDSSNREPGGVGPRDGPPPDESPIAAGDGPTDGPPPDDVGARDDGPPPEESPIAGDGPTDGPPPDDVGARDDGPPLEESPIAAGDAPPNDSPPNEENVATQSPASTNSETGSSSLPVAAPPPVSADAAPVAPPQPVAPAPPSPVPTRKAPTPVDSADVGDKTLASVSPPSPPKPATQSQAVSVKTIPVVPGGVVNVQVPVPPRPPAGLVGTPKIPSIGNSSNW